MAAFDLVVLSSSPPVSRSRDDFVTTLPINQQHAAMPAYSPISLTRLGSSNKLPAGANPLTESPGTGAAREPDFNATGAFFLKSHHFDLENRHDTVDPQPVQSRHNPLKDNEEDQGVRKARKRSQKTGGAGDAAEPKPKKPRARKAKAERDEDVSNSGSRVTAYSTSSYFPSAAPPDMIEPPFEQPAAKTKTAKPRKSRAKKDNSETGDNNAVLKTAAVTKSRRKPQHRGYTDTTEQIQATAIGDENGCVAVIEHGGEVHNIVEESIWDVPKSPGRREKVPPKQRPPDDPNEPLKLDDAVARRKNWTPVKDTTFHSALAISGEKEDANSTVAMEKSTFTALLTSYAFANAEQSTTTMPSPPQPEGAAMKKRRVKLIEVSDNQSVSCNLSPEKGKAPKKKARTITDLVTGQYTPKQAVPSPSTATRNYFSPHATTSKVPLNDVSNLPTGNTKTMTARRHTSSKTSDKATAKSRQVSTKTAAKPKIVTEKLLSPASAIMQMNKQEVLFGTSSQLALEESPTMLRQIQVAIRESEQDAIQSRSRIMQRLSRVGARRQLWAASARDEDGLLFENHDVYMPEPDRTQDLPLLLDGTHDDTPHDSHVIPSSPFANIDDFLPPQAQVSSKLRTTSHPVRGRDHSITRQTSDMSFENIDDYEPPPPSNQYAESGFLDIDDFSPSIQRPTPPRNLFKTATSLLNTSTGSLKKRRDYPPKSQIAIPQSVPSPPPKRFASKGEQTIRSPPNTPPKLSRFADIEEILDSEDDEAVSPTPPRTMRSADSLRLCLASADPLLPPKLHKANVGANADPGLVPVFRIPTSKLEWNNIKNEVFTRITSHIRSLPPTMDPQNPSWHEKILMYDPVVLEDFTTYLNTMTPIRTYKRATPKQIKTFNKSQKAEGKDEALGVLEGGEEALVVENELEIGNVRGWCESLSVCCISKDGRGKGWARKGLY